MLTHHRIEGFQPSIQQDYGLTISPKNYCDRIAEHLYISQADQGIVAEVKGLSRDRPLRVLDLGCGPGRITPLLTLDANFVVGVDISQSFIDYAQREGKGNRLIEYTCADFLQDDWEEKVYDVVVVQGVLHHIHPPKRESLVNRIARITTNLIVGDEFIRTYDTAAERQRYAFHLYCHIIGAAIEGGFDELACEEAANLIDDVFSGDVEAGIHDARVIREVLEVAQGIHSLIWRGEQPNSAAAIEAISLNVRSTLLTNGISRGDYKISIDALEDELKESFKLMSSRLYGPVKTFGGMAVLRFTRK